MRRRPRNSLIPPEWSRIFWTAVAGLWLIALAVKLVIEAVRWVAGRP